MYSNICLAYNLIPDLSCSNDYGVAWKSANIATRSSRLLVCDATLAMMSEPMFTLKFDLLFEE